MTEVHLNTQSRTCGATTIVSGQDFMKIDGLLVSVEGDLNSHGGGNLISSQSFVKINGKDVILKGDDALPDGLCGSAGGEHCSPNAAEGTSLMTINTMNG